MAIKPETVRIDSLKFDPNNVNTHGAESITALVKSLKKFGQQRRILVDADGVVLAGNGLLRAAMRLCWETIEVDRTDLSGAKAKAYAIADNMTAKLSEINHNVLSEQYESIRRELENVSTVGISEEDIDRLAKQTSEELDQLIDAMALQSKDFKAMRKKKPEPVNDPGTDPGPESKSSVNYLVIVKCSGEDSQRQTYESLKNSGYSVEMART